MKPKLIIACVLLLIGGSANASIFEDAVDTEELANALFNCPKDIQKLKDMTRGEGIKYVSSVEGQFRRISEGVTEKDYILTSAASAGGLVFEINASASIRITLKVTQTGYGLPSETEWTCSKR